MGPTRWYLDTNKNRRGQIRIQVRSAIAFAMLFVWGLMALTGLLLYLAPAGPHSGRITIFLLTKQQWGDLHFWMGLLALSLTVVHVVVDWRALKACFHYLSSGERTPFPVQEVPAGKTERN